MQWTEEKIRKFAQMKAEGYTLGEIADELGCTYAAAATQSRDIKRAQKKAEAAKVTEVTEVTETAEPTEAPTATVDTPTETPTETPAAEKTTNAENNADATFNNAFGRINSAESVLNHAIAPTDTPTKTADAPTATPIDHSAEPRIKVSRADILDRAKAIVTGEREKQYGKPEDNFATIGKLWEIYLRGRCVGGDADISINPEDVAMMMALLKIARIMTGTGTGDSFVDLAGYAACAGEIAGRGTVASVQGTGDAKNEETSKLSGEICDAQRAE